MAVFINAIESVLVLFILMAVGYWMGHKKWMGQAEKNFLNKFIFNIAVPCNCVVGILNNLDAGMLSSALVMLGAAFFGMVVALLLSALVATGLKLPRSQWGIFVSMGGISNVVFIGLPLNKQLFGDACVPYVMIYYLANTFFLQTLVTFLIERAGPDGKGKGQSAKDVALNLLKKPPIITVMLTILMLVFAVRPPEVLMRVFGYMSGTLSPLALIYCGFVLYEAGIKNLSLRGGMPAMLMIRYLAAPVICFTMCRLFGVTGLARDVFIVSSSLPIATQITVLAGRFHADEQYAITGACLSTFGCFFTIPILIMLLG